MVCQHPINGQNWWSAACEFISRSWHLRTRKMLDFFGIRLRLFIIWMQIYALSSNNCTRFLLVFVGLVFMRLQLEWSPPAIFSQRKTCTHQNGGIMQGSLCQTSARVAPCSVPHMCPVEWGSQEMLHRNAVTGDLKSLCKTHLNLYMFSWLSHTLFCF